MAQINGGQHSFLSQTLPASSRLAGLGGINASTKDWDQGFAVHNPSLLNPQMQGFISFNHAFYLAGVSYGTLAYSDVFKNGLQWQGAMQYFGYGNFIRTDPQGREIGTFKGGDYAFSFGAALSREKLSYGLRLKLLSANIAEFNSIALATDLSATFEDSARRLIITGSLHNVGSHLKKFDSEIEQDLPLDLRIGISKRLEHLPFRFSVNAHRLNRNDVRYDDPNAQVQNFLSEEDTVTNDPNWFGRTFSGNNIDNFFRHFVFAGEFYFGKVVNLQLSYNHIRRQELALSTAQGLSGFSLGAGVKLSKFHLNYSVATYHKAGASHQIGLSSNWRSFGKGS